MATNSKPTQTIESIGSRNGLLVSIIDVGAAIRSISIPTSHGRIDAVLAYAEPSSYRADPFYLGSTVGPVANRIRNAEFWMNETRYRLDPNETSRNNCLHGGSNGLHSQKFSLQRDKNASTITCRTALPDGLDGFPGNRSFDVVYELLDEWTLAIDFKATTDRDTVVNLANHAYFNLGGQLDDHRLSVFAETYTPVDNVLIPTGEKRDVSDSVFDLRELQPLGARKFDHNFVLADAGDEPRPAAVLESPETGLQLSVLTTQPAMQVYTGDYLSDPFHPRQGICFEAQGFPDAPNQTKFPSIRLEAGKAYRHRTVYQFAFVDGRDQTTPVS